MSWKRVLLALAVGFLLGGVVGAGFGAWIAGSDLPRDDRVSQTELKSMLLADRIAEGMNSGALFALVGAPAMLGLVWATSAFRKRE